MNSIFHLLSLRTRQQIARELSAANGALDEADRRALDGALSDIIVAGHHGALDAMAEAMQAARTSLAEATTLAEMASMDGALDETRVAIENMEKVMDEALVVVLNKLAGDVY